MPLLYWPASTLALTNQHQRREMTRLFDAYFRVTAEQDWEMLRARNLPLDLPGDTGNRNYFYARFIKDRGWSVDFGIKREHMAIIALVPI
jgi:hypothetical protein